jgi:hypothetical protein
MKITRTTSIEVEDNKLVVTYEQGNVFIQEKGNGTESVMIDAAMMRRAMPLLETLLKEAKVETNTEYGAVNAEDIKD